MNKLIFEFVVIKGSIQSHFCKTLSHPTPIAAKPHYRRDMLCKIFKKSVKGCRAECVTCIYLHVDLLEMIMKSLQARCIILKGYLVHFGSNINNIIKFY